MTDHLLEVAYPAPTTAADREWREPASSLVEFECLGCQFRTNRDSEVRDHLAYHLGYCGWTSHKTYIEPADFYYRWC
jgi:hypothetical protein